VWGNIYDCLLFKMANAKCNEIGDINIVLYPYYLKNREFFDRLAKEKIVIIIDREKDVFMEEIERISKKLLGISLKI